MSRPALDWPVAALGQALAPAWPGLAVQVLAEVDSTNAELMRRVRSGQMAPTLLVAERQSAGRGRLGRAWRSAGDGAPGAALMFSLGLPLAPRDWSGLSLAVGLSVAESLHPELRLKWPNDLWWQGRKLGGILIETAGSGGAEAPRAAVIGVGLNLRPVDGAGLRTAPAWLHELWPGAPADEVLLRIAAPLGRALRDFEHAGFAPLAERFNARDALAGQPVALSDGTEGVAHGVDAQGALGLRTASGAWHTVHSAEVSVRPRPAQGEHR